MSDRTHPVVATRNAAEGLGRLLRSRFADGASGNPDSGCSGEREIQSLLVTPALPTPWWEVRRFRLARPWRWIPMTGLLAVRRPGAAILRGDRSFRAGLAWSRSVRRHASLPRRSPRKRIRARWPALDDAKVRTGLQPYRYLIARSRGTAGTRRPPTPPTLPADPSASAVGSGCGASGARRSGPDRLVSVRDCSSAAPPYDDCGSCTRCRRSASCARHIVSLAPPSRGSGRTYGAAGHRVTNGQPGDESGTAEPVVRPPCKSSGAFGGHDLLFSGS